MKAINSQLSFNACFDFLDVIILRNAVDKSPQKLGALQVHYVELHWQSHHVIEDRIINLCVKLLC